MQGLYQLDVQGYDLIGRLDDFFIENERDQFARKLASEWTKGTWENLGQCDELIADSIIKWKLSRLSPVDKSILRLSVYQLKFCGDIPPKVSINEAVDIAKKFGTAESGAFINGIIDSIRLAQENGENLVIFGNHT